MVDLLRVKLQAYRYVQRPVQPLPVDGMGYGEDGYDAYVSIQGERCTDARLAVSGKRARIGLFPAFPLVRMAVMQTGLSHLSPYERSEVCLYNVT